MRHKLLFLILTLAPCAAFAQSQPPASTTTDVKSQIAALDKQIAEFTKGRDQLNAKAYEAGSRATQFLGQDWVNYQRALAQQEKAQKEAKLLDEHITELKKQKAALEAKSI